MQKKEQGGPTDMIMSFLAHQTNKQTNNEECYGISEDYPWVIQALIVICMGPIKPTRSSSSSWWNLTS
jgi:hypothetical protein